MRLSIVFFSSRTSSGEPLSPLLLLPPAGFDRSVAFSLRSRSISPLFFFGRNSGTSVFQPFGFMKILG
jgi:hypothetical protein